MKILFLTEHGEGIGFGHVNRCMALADGFSKFNCEITFVSSGVPAEFKPNRGYSFFHCEWNNSHYLKENLNSFDITVTDSYSVTDTTLEQIAKNSKTPVYLIDSKLKFYPDGILLFPSIYASNYKFNDYENIHLISGIDYLLYTKELWNINVSKINKRVKKIGISLGGYANKGVNKILSAIEKNTPNIESISIFGNLNNEIEKKVNSEFCEIRGFLTKKEYVRHLTEMDVMICNGGQSLNESLLLGIPTMTLICADNQRENTDSWEKLGVTISMDIRNDFEESEFTNNLSEMISYDSRNKVNKKCRSLIDHKGAIRSAKRILELINQK